MIKYSRFFITLIFAVTAIGAMAQSTATTSSPYSQFGLGDIDQVGLPQNIGMGGIGTAINRISGYNNISLLNPASYGAINYTIIDAGIYSNVVSLNQIGKPASSNANFRLSHVVFAVPVSKRSALSFGLTPYSEMGYNYKQTSNKGFGTGSPADTNTVNYIYRGDGGLSKAYLGYGFGLGKHLLLGANVSYIFGNLQQFSSTEIPALYGTLNSRVEQSNSVGGLNYDYGLQYSFDFGAQKQNHLILGYSASANSKLTTTNTYIVSQYTYDANGNENLASDSLISRQGSKSKIQLPQINHFGISYQEGLKFLVGADFSMGKWSGLTVSGANAGLQDSKTLNVGGQFTPNINALHNYFARTDYRLGFIYDQTYLNLNNTNIERYAVTFGLGLPLAPNNTSFYKINFSAEIGQRGRLTGGLVKENYVNFHLGFTLNDKWFQRYKFE
ncbi:MAG: hypothetical protein M3N14_10475 [Bacteroidota bacterium]|nr:hypothetical protein [Bacteroidota bacterium]